MADTDKIMGNPKPAKVHRCTETTEAQVGVL